MSLSINNGWIDGADIVKSPNTSGHIQPRFIVMHYTATWSARSAIRTLSTRGSKVSAHFVVDTDGALTQLVSTDVKAWHAGPSEWNGVRNLNNCSIGIEIVNPGFLKECSNGCWEDHTGQVIDPLPDGIFERHRRVGSGEYFWPAYTDEQLEAVADLVRCLTNTYPIEDIVTHEEIDTRGWKTDPGPAFPMGLYADILDGIDKDYWYVKTAKLNVRGGPGLKYKVVGSLRQGDAVEIIEEDGDWCRIGDEEWIHGNYVGR